MGNKKYVQPEPVLNYNMSHKMQHEPVSQY